MKTMKKVSVLAICIICIAFALSNTAKAGGGGGQWYYDKSGQCHGYCEGQPNFISQPSLFASGKQSGSYHIDKEGNCIGDCPDHLTDIKKRSFYIDDNGKCRTTDGEECPKTLFQNTIEDLEKENAHLKVELKEEKRKHKRDMHLAGIVFMIVGFIAGFIIKRQQ